MKHIFYDLVDNKIELRVYDKKGWCVYNENFELQEEKTKK